MAATTTDGPTTAAAAAAAAAAAVSNKDDDKKRKHDHEAFRSSKYFKIRDIVKDLRPFFIEVSRTPNFRDSKAAQDILIRMKMLIELTKHLRSETPSEEPLQEAVKTEQMEQQEGESLQANVKPEQIEEEKLTSHLQPERKEEINELLNLDKEDFPGHVLVGGSPIGWNFLVYPGQRLVYYGVSKEIALARRVAK